MECERFKKLLKTWYIQVQNEALAPARMVTFMEKHLESCQVCMFDPEARKDVKKIITLVLPQDKLKAPSRSNRKANMPLGGPGLPDPPEPLDDDDESYDEDDDETQEDEEEDEDVEIDEFDPEADEDDLELVEP